MKAVKATMLAGAVFDLGVILVPSAHAQTATSEPATPAVAQSTRSGIWMKYDAANFEKWSGSRQEGIRSCLAKGGTPLSVVNGDGKVNLQDLSFCVTVKR